MVPSVFLSSALSTTTLKQTILAPTSDSWKTERKSNGQHCHKPPNQPLTYDTCKRHGLVLLSEPVREKLFPQRSSEVNVILLAASSSHSVLHQSCPDSNSQKKQSEKPLLRLGCRAWECKPHIYARALHGLECRKSTRETSTSQQNKQHSVESCQTWQVPSIEESVWPIHDGQQSDGQPWQYKHDRIF